MRVLVTILVFALLPGCAEVPADCDGDCCDGTGCADPSLSATATSGGGGGGNGFAIQQGTAHGSKQGIDVDVTWKACDAGFCANATATNNGGSTVQVSSICESPWTDRMAHDGKPVEHREPQFTCLAYGRAPFAPGDSRQANFTWDGQLHDDDPAVWAPEGAYTWTIAFWWDDADGGARQEAAADVHLIVGET